MTHGPEVVAGMAVAGEVAGAGHGTLWAGEAA
jgi:hypothetical protein